MLVLTVLVVCGWAEVLGDILMIDLTHTFGTPAVYWPANPPYNFTLVDQVDIGGTTVTSNAFQTAEHSGTHIDAPSHFCPGNLHVHELPFHRMSGPGFVMDFRSQAARDFDYQVTLQDVKDWEQKYCKIPEGAIVLFNFGWNQFWPDWEKIFNSNQFNDTSTFHFPGIGIEASRYLAGTRKVTAIGTDCPTPDYGQSKTYEVHVNLLCENGVIIIENVGNIDALPTFGTRIFIGAIKLEKGTGTPVRLFAVKDDTRSQGHGQPGETTFTNRCVGSDGSRESSCFGLVFLNILVIASMVVNLVE